MDESYDNLDLLPDEGFLVQDLKNTDFLKIDLAQAEEWPPAYASDSDHSSTHVYTGEWSISDRDLSEPRKLGRKRLPETAFLFNYSTIRSNHPPKKENLRIQLFRGFVKLIEALKSNKPLTQRINAYWGGDSRAYESTLQALKSFLFDNWEEISTLVENFKTPKASGLSSYSDAFFMTVMKKEAMKIAMGLYVEFVFSDGSDGVLERKLNLVCCKLKLAEEALSQWEKLRNYFKEQLFAESK